MLFASSSSYLQANRLVLSTASKRMLLQQATIAKTSVGLNVRSFTCGSMLHYAQHGHAATTGPQESLYDAVKKRFPMEESVLKKRFDQLKRNHMQILSLDINWNVLKPEEREEKLRELGDLVSRGYHLYTPEQKKAVSLQNVYTVSYQNTPAWDDILSKNDELQAGDWRNMSLEEKKAAHFLAWGPVAEANTEFRQAVGIRVALILAGVFGAYMALRAFFRSRKELPTLEPEWVEASRERMIHERMNPYTGESAHLFTKDGIKEQ